MPQFSISRSAEVGETLPLAETDTHHLRDVLRYPLGKTIQLTDKKQHRYQARLIDYSSSGAVVEILSKETLPSSSATLRIAQSLPKSDAWEMILQKSVELGVTELLPFLSSRTVIKIKHSPSKEVRWKKIIEAAHKQCGRVDEMALASPDLFENILKKSGEDHKLLFWEQATSSLKDYFQQHPVKKPVFCLIGPEGGFSESEAEQAQKAGFNLLSLGPRILRVETAAIAAMSLIQYELGNI